MKRTFSLLLFFIAIAAFTQWVVIKYIPNAVHAIAVWRVHKTNEWISNNKTSDSMRTVVLPNPDFIYSALFYNVREHDLTVNGVLPDSVYGSVAFYDDRCQPFYVYNNLDSTRKGAFHFLLSSQTSTGDNQVKAKSGTGVIICRYLVKSDSAFAAMKQLQSRLSSKAM
jgi:uncharacterized membrane protein